MASRNIHRLLTAALKAGEKFGLASGDVLKILPAVDDTGYLQIGDGTYDMDVKVYLGNTAAYVLLDVGNQSLTLSNVAFTVTGALNTTGDVIVTGALNATGAVKFSTTLNTVGAVVFGNTLGVTLGITGNTLKINTTSNTVGAAVFGNTIDATLGVTCNELKVNTVSNTVGAALFGNTVGVTLGMTCNTLKVNTTSNTVGAAVFGNTIDATLGVTCNELKVNTVSNTVGAAVFGNTVNTTGALTCSNTIDVTLGATCNTLKVNTTSNTVGAALFGNTIDVTLGATANTLKVNTTSNTVGAALFGNTIDVTLGATCNTLKVNTTSNTVGAAVFGNTIDVTLNATVGATGLSRVTGFNALSNRFELKWIPGAGRGKPGIAGDAVDNTTATFAITDPMFMVSGTNCVSSCVTFDATGGILLTTTAAAGDEVILDAHSLANLSAWKTTSWLSNTEIQWECLIKTGADIVNSVIWAGLKLTNTPVVATDDDQVYFRYETVANGAFWTVVDSIADSDVVTQTTVAVANSTAAHLKIAIAGDRTAKCYINGALVRTTAALATNKSFIPVLGIQAVDAAVVSATVRGIAISKTI